MGLIPKKVKYKKAHRGRRKGKSLRGNELNYGEFGLKAVEPGWITLQQMEAARIAIAHGLKRGGKTFLRVITDKPVSHKPLETRMGKGKGDVEKWVSVVKPGRILLEIEGVEESLARKVLKVAAHKMPIKVKIISRKKLEI